MVARLIEIAQSLDKSGESGSGGITIHTTNITTGNINDYGTV